MELVTPPIWGWGRSCPNVEDPVTEQGPARLAVIAALRAATMTRPY